jgi:PKD repeat protein
VTATNSGCSGAQGTRSITISTGDTGGTLQAAFTFSPAAPQVNAPVSFDSSSSTAVPVDANVGWDFGDGSPVVSGRTVSHTYANAGNYSVRLSITPLGCLNTTCLSQTTKTLSVTGGPPPPPPVSAEWSASVTCTNVFGIEQCPAVTGTAVTLTAGAADATSYSWSFGDNTTGTGKQVTHTWPAAGSYAVSLTVAANGQTATKTRTFVVTGAPPPPPPPPLKSALLPWLAQSRGAFVQSTDLYVHNPGTTPMSITLEFRKRGLPDVNPPRVTRVIQPGATLYAADVLREIFNRENVAGFVTVVAAQGATAEPVITSFHTTVRADGKLFGQTVPGTSLTSVGSAVGTADTSSQYLVGLSDNAERQTYFGFSNPSDQAATYRLRLSDSTGRLIIESDDQTLSRFGQRQFQTQDIRDLFGVSNLVDYRVEVKPVSGAKVYPFGSNLRVATTDPSFLTAGSYRNSKVYLLGVQNAGGPNGTLWQTDLLLANVGDQVTQTDVTFTSVGVVVPVTAPYHITLQPGRTQRIENVVSSQLGVRDGGVGVLTLSSTSANGIFPIVNGESYENSKPTKRYGQSIQPLTDANAADSTKKELLVGLRQDAKSRTTMWLFNPSSVTGEYDIIYRGLDGTVLGRTQGVRLGAGRLRQFLPSQHPLPAAGVTGGFTVEVVVKSGKALAAAQVINNASNDPAYVQGEAR